MTLTDLRAKYKFEGGKYEPKPDCKFCHGSGEREIKTTRIIKMFCICLYVSHDMSDFAGDSLSSMVKELKK